MSSCDSYKLFKKSGINPFPDFTLTLKKLRDKHMKKSVRDAVQVLIV